MVIHLGSFLVVEPDADTAAVLTRLCKKLRRARLVASAAEARSVLERDHKLTGVIVEEDLPDDRGTTLLKEVRSANPLLPVLVLTGNTHPDVINRAHRYRGEFLAKPTRRQALMGFLARAVAFERVPEERVSFLIDATVAQCGLTPRESDVLAAAVAGTPRKEIAAQIGTSENTVKSVVKSALRKLPHGSLDEAAREILHHALDGSAVTMPRDPFDSQEMPAPKGPMTIRPSRGRDE